MGINQTLQPNGEANISGTHNVLHLEINIRLRLESNPLHDVGELLGSQAGIVRRFGPRDAHFAAGKNQSGSARLPEAHDDSRKAAGIEFRVAAFEGDLLQVEADA